MIVTIFRSRLAPGVEDEYFPLAERMSKLATAMPGYISHKSFVADDGERVTVVVFETPEAHRAWQTHRDHLQAQKKGREQFYSEYHIQVCEVVRESQFKRAAKS